MEGEEWVLMEEQVALEEVEDLELEDLEVELVEEQVEGVLRLATLS